MIDARILALPLAAVALPQAASACPYRDAETYMLLDRQPPVPNGAVTLKVRVARDDVDHDKAKAVLVEPAPAIFGARTIAIAASEWTSCSRWGLVGETAYVVGYLRRGVDGTLVMTVVQNRWPHDPAYPPKRATTS